MSARKTNWWLRKQRAWETNWCKKMDEAGLREATKGQPLAEQLRHEQSAKQQLRLTLEELRQLDSTTDLEAMRHCWPWAPMWVELRENMGLSKEEAIAAISDGWCDIDDQTPADEPAKEPLLLVAVLWWAVKAAAIGRNRVPRDKNRTTRDEKWISKCELDEATETAQELLAICAERVTLRQRRVLKAMVSAVWSDECKVNQPKLARILGCSVSTAHRQLHQVFQECRRIIRETRKEDERKRASKWGDRDRDARGSAAIAGCARTGENAECLGTERARTSAGCGSNIAAN